MQEFKQQMAEIEASSGSLATQVTGLYARAKNASIDWLQEPLVPTPALRTWLKQHELPLNPTMDEFLDICFDTAKTMDLESRVLTFSRADAAVLWDGLRRPTVFDMIGLIPKLFTAATVSSA